MLRRVLINQGYYRRLSDEQRPELFTTKGFTQIALHLSLPQMPKGNNIVYAVPSKSIKEGYRFLVDNDVCQRREYKLLNFYYKSAPCRGFCIYFIT